MAKYGELSLPSNGCSTAPRDRAPGPSSILYLHSVLAQIEPALRDPGDHVRVWRSQARPRLAAHQSRRRVRRGRHFRPVGLPWGTKPRLILAHLNAEALRTGSPVIEVEASLCAFVERLGFSREGRTIRTVKDQLTRLATAEIGWALPCPKGGDRCRATSSAAFELWQPKDARPACPMALDRPPVGRVFRQPGQACRAARRAALVALSQNSMALDIYVWLAQRLHRMSQAEPARLPWPGLQQQFGQGYRPHPTISAAVFRSTLAMVLSQYRGARVE